MINYLTKYTIYKLQAKLVRGIFMLLCFNLALISNAQNYIFNFNKYDTEDGLLSSLVYDVTEDANGFIWVSSNIGLQKFDSYNFTTIIKYNPEFIPTDIFVDSKNRIWLFHIRKFFEDSNLKAKVEYQLYDLNSNKFVNIEKRAPFQSTEVSWISTNQKSGVYFFVQDENGEKSTYTYKDEFQRLHSGHQYFTNPGEDENHGETKGQESALDTKIEANTNFFQLEKFKGKNYVFKNLNGEQDANFKFDLYSNEGVYLDNSETKVIIPYYNVQIDKRGLIWSWFTDDLVAFNINTGETSNPYQSLVDKMEITSINNIFIDTRNNIWISTKNGMVRMYYKIGIVDIALAHKNISTRGISQLNDSTIYVNTYEGVYNVNVNSLQQSLIDNKHGTFPYYYDIVSIGGKLLLTTQLGRIDFTDYKFENFNELIYPNLDKDHWSRNEIAITDDGHIYMSNDQGIFELIDNEVRELSLNPKLKRDEMFFFANVNGSLIRTSDAGLFILDDSTKKITHYFQDTLISYVHKDINEQSTYWLGGNHGVIKWDSSKNTREVYDTDNGLTSYDITGILQDSLDRIWVGTFDGINILEPQSGVFTNLNQSDGLTINELNFGSLLQLSDGRFCFGSVNGLNIIEPSLYKTGRNAENNKLNKIQILSTEVLSSRKGKNVVTDNINVSPKRLEFTDDMVQKTIWFSELDYTTKKSKKYRYRIIKEDQEVSEWNYTQKNNIALQWHPYGVYKLEVQSLGPNNSPDSEILEMEIVFIRPFYKTAGFIGSLILLGILLIFVLWKIRTKTLREKNLQLENEIQERIREISEKNIELENSNQFKDKLFAVLAHDLRSPLISLQNLSNIISFLVKRNEPERILEVGSSIQKRVTSLVNLVDNILNWSLQQQRQVRINPVYIHVQNIVNDIKSSYGELLSEKNITLDIEIDEDNIMFYDHRALQTILRNLVDNAIKFSHSDTTITIRSKTVGQTTELEVIDQGVGIHSLENNDSIPSYQNSKLGTEGEKGMGLGLNICHELALLNNSTITFANNSPKGAIFTLRAPLGPPDIT